MRITFGGDVKNGFALVNPWPEALSGELEAVKRIKLASHNLGIKCFIVDGDGWILNENHEITQKRISNEDVDFVLSSHFNVSKTWDVFTYGLLWNPPLIMASWPEYTRYTDNHCIYDDNIGNDASGIMSHAELILRDRDYSFNRDIYFFPSVSEKSILKPNLHDELKIFYCGMQWEKSAGQPKRHDYIFRELDETNYFVAYGPEKANGLTPWEGYKSYRGSLPFDGESVIREINKCGVALAISSSMHHKCGAMSNRLYEAIAGGAIAITDDNEFIRKYFSDTVLTIKSDYGDQAAVVEEIKNHFEWIKNHRSEALSMVEKSQLILREKFTYEVTLKNLFEKHTENRRKLDSFFKAQDQSDTIDVILRWEKESLNEFLNTLQYVNCQEYKNLNLIVLCDKIAAKKIRDLIEKHLEKNITYKVIEIDLFNKKVIQYSGFYRKYTTGEMLVLAKNHLTSKYVSFLKADDIWFSDHLTTLKRQLEDNPEKVASYSGLFSEIFRYNNKMNYSVDFFKNISVLQLLHFNPRENEARILLKTEFLQNIPSVALIYLDYYEYHFLLLDLIIAHKAIFSKRLTCGVKYYEEYEKNSNVHLNIERHLQVKFIRDIYKNHIHYDEYDKMLYSVQAGTINFNSLNTLTIENFNGIFKVKLKEIIIRRFPFSRPVVRGFKFVWRALFK